MSHFVARWLKISLVVIVGCGFLAMMIYALMNRDEIRSSQIEPPLIMPASEPLKRRPDQPGGMQIPNRDKLVFDLLDSSNTTLGETGISGNAKVEDISVTSDVAGANPTIVSDSVQAVEAVGMDVQEDDAKAETVAPVKVVAVAPSPSVVVKPVEAAKVIAPVKVEPIKTVEKAVEKKVEVKVAEKPVVGGKWGVQLAAVNSVADGNAMTSKASKDFAALKALTPKVSAAPGGKKYRVQFVGLKDRDAAAAVCAKLAGKQACFPVSIQ